MKSLFLLLLLALCSVATAQVTEPYSESFEGLDTSVEGFAPKGWGHQVSSWYDFYGLYSLQDGGHTGQYLLCESQSNYETAATSDYLVSPVVLGKVTLWAKGNAGFVSFFEATDNGDGTFSIGSKIVPVTAPELDDTWQQYELNIAEETRIAIYASEGTGIDDFGAEHARVMVSARPVLLFGGSEIASGSSIAFGTAQHQVQRQLTLCNRGDAPLQVTSLRVEGLGFTVSPYGAFTLDEGQERTVTLTMASSPYDYKTATLYLQAEGQDDFTLLLSGLSVDPKKWFVDFEEGFPSNMLVGDAWSIKEVTNAKLQEEQGQKVAEVSADTWRSDYRLVSPRLLVAEGEKLFFEATKTNYLPEFHIFYSSDRTTWTEIASQFEKGDFGRYPKEEYPSFFIDDIPAGEQYIAFEGKGVQIDNIYGFTPVSTDFDLVVTAGQVPTAAEVNQTVEALLSVHNLGGAIAADSYRAEFVVADAIVATADAVAIAEGADATFRFRYTPHQSGSDLTALVRLVTNGGQLMAQSSQAMLTIAPEQLKSGLVIGTPSSVTQNKVPVYTAAKYSYADIVYPAAKTGLAIGDKITRLAFRGNNMSARKGQVKAWVELTDTEQPATTWSSVLPTKPTMDAEWAFPQGDGEEMLAIDLSKEPLVYDGRNLRLRFLTEMQTTGGSVNFFSDEEAGQASYDYENSLLSIPTLYDCKAPVCYVTLAAEQLCLKGQVTDRATRQPLSGAQVLLKSGEVEYTATTDASGSYAIDVMKRLDYELTISLDGYFNYTRSISFADNAVQQLDVELLQARGLYIVGSTMPTTAIVNTPYTVTLQVQNADKTDFADGSYTVSLFADGRQVATAQGEQLPSLSVKEYTLSFLPESEGTLQVYAQVAWGTETAATEAQTVTVAPEPVGSELTIGTATDTKSGVAPAHTFFTANLSSMVYSRELLAALPENVYVSNLVIRGKNNNYGDPLEAGVQVWMQNTDDGEDTDPVFNTDDMTLVYDGTQTFQQSQELIDKYVIALNTPFCYDGRNLRIVVKTVSESYGTQSFEVDESHTAWLKSADSYDDAVAAEATATALPVLHLSFLYRLPSVIKGDANGDGIVNVSDVTAIINHILGKTPDGFLPEAADVNNDGIINVTDVTSTINIILQK